jgi:hypothetical protein
MTSKEKAFNNYADYRYRSMILDVIASEKQLDEPTLLSFILKETEHDGELGNVTLAFIGNSYHKLIHAKLLEGEYKTGIIRLTEYGESAVRNGTWHGLALTAWVGYKSLMMAQWALWLALGSFVVAITSLLIVGLK